MRAHFPRCYRRREPRALRARPAHVRGPPALLRQYPLDAGRRRPRHRGARGRRRAGNLRPAHPGRRRARAASRASTSPITGRCGACSPACTAISAPPCWSIAIPCPRPPARRTSGRGRNSCSATATAPAASAWWRRRVEATLRGLGYSVSRNKPYAGGFITEHYGNPAAGLHAIQLEINRALYMDERRYERSAALRAPGGRPRDAGAAARRDPAGGAAALSRGGGIAAADSVPDHVAKKGAARGCKRPKSREETPKEGNGSSRYRIATIYTATHKNQDFEAPNYMQIMHGCGSPFSQEIKHLPSLVAEMPQTAGKGPANRANGHAGPPYGVPVAGSGGLR